MSNWDPELYARFSNERSRPFADLLAQTPGVAPLRAVDLGCGTGELTRSVHEHFGSRHTVGVDNSAEMLAKAEPTDGVTFEEADITQWLCDHNDGSFDLIFSNAALHWVSGHHTLGFHLYDTLAPNGVLAFQVPANDRHPSHVVAAKVAGTEPFFEAMGGQTKRTEVLKPAQYAQMLHALGFEQIDVRLRVYLHELSSWSKVVEWVRGTLLTWYLDRLPARLHHDFIAEYTAELADHLDRASPYMYTYDRILVTAVKPA